MEIDKLISDYLSGQLSDDSHKKLEDWLDEDPSNREQLELLSKVWETKSEYPNIVNIDDERQKIWNRISNDRERQKKSGNKTIRIIRRSLQYAAIITILALAYYFYTNQPEKKNDPVVTTIERINPLGQKSRIQLPDGSTVWLNADSRLSYSSDFNFKARTLHLEGEAYFEVAKNHEMPFEVFTKDLVITAVGTAFNVNAFGHQTTEKIALKNGKVKIECLEDPNGNCTPSFLEPGEQAFFSNQTGSISISLFSDNDPFGWKDGKLIFKHASFDDVIEVLSRWYNVEFVVNGNLKHNWNYSGTYDNEVLENILKSLEYSEKIKYKINGSTIEITL